MGRWMTKLKELPTKESKHAEIIRQRYKPVETVSLIEGWRQLESGTWQGIGLLETLPDYTHIFGQEIIISDRDYVELRQQFPNILILKPDEFKQIIDDWPESTVIVLTMRQFGGQLVS